jgi:hypothetical protein
MKLNLGLLALLGVLAVSCTKILTPVPPVPCPEETSCPEPTPTLNPTPVPTPSPLDMLLRRDSTTFISLETRTPVPIELAIACCTEWPVPTGWPQVTTEFIDYVQPNMTAVQMRLGPYLEAAEPAAPYGGAYAEVNGKADLLHFSPRFWSGARQTIEYARSKGVYVFIDIADGWAMKHAQGIGFPLPHPWKAENNIQGEDHITGAGNTIDGVHRTWINKVIQEFGPYDNVVWMDGVEISLTLGYRARWSIEMRDIVRSSERAFRFPVHLFGTNGNDEARQGDVDYIIVHGSTPRAPMYNKPTITTEYNPKTPLTAEQITANSCLAQNIGSYYGLWRHTMHQSEVDSALATWGECLKVVYCVPAGQPESNWKEPPIPPEDRRHQMHDAVEYAKSVVGDRCGQDPAQTLALLSGVLNDAGYCASGPWGKSDGQGDALAIKAGDGLIEEWHPVFFGNGCLLSKYKFAWEYLGG